MHNIVSLLKKKAQKYSQKPALLYLEDGENETAHLSYGELDQHAKAIAAELQTHHEAGQRIILLYPTGIDFITSLMGCWYAGIIAVPVHCPKQDELKHHQLILNGIANDAEISAVLTLSAYRSNLKSIISKKIRIIATDEIDYTKIENYQSVGIQNDTIAYLQYTSGSTSSPKAVVVTHGNLTHSLKETIKAWHYTSDSVTLHWAPHTHVYGLVCGLLVPLYHGSRAIIMPPSAFIKKPLVWLSAISRYQVSHSGCPNFGYDLCLQHIKNEEVSQLNLKSWKVAVNGGDMVQSQTLTEFVNKFGSCGFALSHFCSAYGMSEAAGLIASTPLTDSPQLLTLPNQTEATACSRVSSGQLITGLQATIVDSETGQALADGETGEIWLSGKSVANGYWRRPEETNEVFNAKIPGNKHAYFRTGDLGLILNQELYLTGRLKEVMIVYGKKYYPLDFEISVAKALHPFQISLPQVVFSQEIEGKEKIIVVQELSESSEPSMHLKISEVIRHAITKEHSIDVYQVLFSPQGALPKTASGKLQRKKAQQLYQNNELTLYTETPLETNTAPSMKTELQTQFTSVVAKILNIDEHKIDLHAPISRYSFDSINILQLTTEINNVYHTSISPALLYEFSTLAALYTFLFDTKGIKSQDSDAQEKEESRDIAIIGISGLFPQSPDLNTYWDNLSQGKDCISEVPLSRWDWHSLTVQWGGFIDGIDHFDASFFNISPREAELIDPQQRLFLQTVWNTIEDAGYAPETIAALKTGLYVGVFNHDYAELLQKNEIMDAYLTTGTMNSMIANRISYFLNLRGPSETIDTACSSSLVAIHQAVQGILNNDCDMAIAGGVNTLTTPTSFISAHQAGMLSPDGRCKTFDKNANGYVRGEGVGALLLKKCALALKDGDHIYGIIKGSAVNHGGHVNTLTAPNPNAQAEVIISACQRAQVAVDTIQYIEAHGTGTPLGDPIEINGLKKAFQQLALDQNLASLPKHYCGIGTVKTQIGHLESAAGIAGMIKILLAMHHETIPANLHFNELNPYIEIENSPFYIMDKPKPWPKQPNTNPRIAGISSFGFGGANAHIIVAEGPLSKASAQYEHSSYLITLSAKTQTTLQQRIADLLNWLNAQNEVPCLASLSYTLNRGRQHFDERFCVVIRTVAELQQQLNDALSGQSISHDALDHPELASEPNFNQLRIDYLQKESLDWHKIYGDYQQKIALPNYPFAKESHWVTAKRDPKELISTPSNESTHSDVSVHYYHPVWIEKPLLITKETQTGSLIIVGQNEENNRAIQSQFEQSGLVCNVITVQEASTLNLETVPDYVLIALEEDQASTPTEEKEIHRHLQQTFYLVHKIIAHLITVQPKHLIKIVCVSQKPSVFSRALVGLAKTLHQEQRNLSCQLVELSDLSLLPQELFQNDIYVRYDLEQKRHICHYEQLMLPTSLPLQKTLKKSGVYLITGGMGKLGALFATYLAEHYEAKIILTGRSAFSEHHKQTIKTLEKKGGKALYIQADTSCKKSTQDLVFTAKEHFGSINGIIHAAGLTNDSLFLNKTTKDMADVLAPKVLGTCILHAATSDEPLDFFVLCSSVSAVFGNRGQSDYAYANAFMDEFATMRASQYSGQTISINWPLWEEGGLKIAPEYQQLLKQTLGIASLSTKEGLIALERALQYGGSNWIILPGNQSKLREELHKKMVINSPLTNQADEAHISKIKSKTELYLKRIIAETIKITPNSIDVNHSFEHYGIDSLMIIQLNERLEKEFSNVPKTLFFEYQNLSSLTDYFVEHHHNSLHHLFSDDVITSPLNSDASQSRLDKYQETQTAYSISTPSIKSKDIEHRSEEPIAIIGIHGLFPQSDTLDSFWHHLVESHDLITEVPPHRWRWQDYYGDEAHQTHCKWGGFIDDFDQFDAGFFNISAREANLMDPQQRLFLQTAWNTIEDAGYNPFDLGAYTVGVFAGVGFSEYQSLITTKQKMYHGLVATGNSHSLIANRVSYFFNFHGPSESIDTACSSSLVAINRAVQAIRSGECNLALAGGVSILLNPDTVVITSQLGALSSDGRCKAFDKAADGFVKSEGVGTVLLKTLTQAQADGDSIYAVIRSTAVNHGGKALSLTAPNVKAQSELLIKAYTQANLKPETITYIETHGTGTSLGDPVEIDSLKLAFNTLLPSHFKGAHIGLGSVKSNMGHLEPAAGIAGIIKLILSMTHEKIPGIVHFKELNPYIQLTDTPFYIVEKTQEWKRIKDESGHEIPLRAGISSFGFGGTNAHVVLEEGRPYQPNQARSAVKPCYLITLSAKKQESLQQKISDLYQWLKTHHESVSLPSLSFTLNAGKAHFLHRCALVVNSTESLLNALNALSNNEIPEYAILNNGQTCTMQSPVFDEVYRMTLSALHQSENKEHYRDKLYILADLYTLHYPIDWQQLYLGESIHRITSLPAYPFIKQRHWYDLDITHQETQPALPGVVPTNNTERSSLILNYLRQLFSEKLHIPKHQIQLDETYEVYGVDSVIGMEITKKLENDFGTMSKTILYEYNRLNHLAQYLIKNHKEQLSKLIGHIPHNEPVLTESTSKPTTESQDIAIIGINIQFPMANTMDEFWQNLITGRDCVGSVPKERWDYQQYPVQISGEEKVFPHGGFISDVDKFDPIFFNIPPRDAALMDPQERLFMQSAWSTLEDGGYTREKLKTLTNSSVGVFAGMTYNSYPLFIAEEWHKGNRLPLNIQSFSLANRVSYFLDVNGPSFVVDTACSSSLTAIHLACESIIHGHCAMAIAGGVNLSLHPSKYHFLGSYNFMSEQGRCTSFAEKGTGYVPSEGIGSILLKPFAQAIADNDFIYGVIKGSSMNHGGKTSGYTVPNPNAQTQVILQALKSARIDARTISYIEAHGTGTALGDPIEIRGLQEAFETHTQDKQFCAVGSVKSNIGHLEAAAGMPQIAKVLLQMRHKKLVPTLHTANLNPFIEFEKSPFYVQQKLSDWQPEDQVPRRAGISSFGAGGVNVHMIIEEYVAPVTQQSALTPPYLFILSALNEDRLAAYIQVMQAYLTKTMQTLNESWLRDACYTLQVGRESMTAKLAVLVHTKDELLTALTEYPNNRNHRLWSTIHPSLTATSVEETGYEELAKQWINGEKIDWAAVHHNDQPSIVSLPTYPFAKRRCWVPSEKVEATTEAQLPSIVPDPSLSQEWLYKTLWEKNPLTTELTTQNSEGKWLIFSDKELGLVLQQILTPADCIYCFTGEQYQQINDQVYYINPRQKADYEQVVNQVHTAHGKELKGIIYLCSSLKTHENTHPDPSVSLLYTFKSLIQHTWQNSLLFSLVSQTAQQLNPFEPIDIWQHHLWSMSRIFAAEQGHYQVLLLDLDEQESLHQNAHHIMHEINHLTPQQNHIAYRANERYTIRFKAYETEEPAAELPHWQPPVAALVTGGLGALGYEVAEFLVSQGTQYLLLTGTSELSDHTIEKNTWLKQLKNKGATINYAAVDVADKNKMQQLLKETEQAWQRPIDGVFHLAGLTTDNITLADMNESLWRKVLDVKIKGALVLHELFNHSNLSSFVLFSSISAVPHFGIAGLSAYAAANEFISGLALYRRSHQQPAISINWVAWSEKGMSHRYNHDVILDTFGIDTLSIHEGMSLLNTILQLNPPEITVCRINWNKFLQINTTIKYHDFFTYVSALTPSESKLIMPTFFNEEEIETQVVDLFVNLLALEQSEVNKDAPFQQYGMDSIIGIQYTEAINRYFPDMVSPMDLYRFPTLYQLTHYISQQVNRHKQPPPAKEKRMPQEQDINELSYAQLNQLLKAELEELECEYE